MPDEAADAAYEKTIREIMEEGAGLFRLAVVPKKAASEVLVSALAGNPAAHLTLRAIANFFLHLPTLKEPLLCFLCDRPIRTLADAGGFCVILTGDDDHLVSHMVMPLCQVHGALQVDKLSGLCTDTLKRLVWPDLKQHDAASVTLTPGHG